MKQPSKTIVTIKKDHFDIFVKIVVREKNISFLLDEWKETQRKRNESKVEWKPICSTVSIT